MRRLLALETTRTRPVILSVVVADMGTDESSFIVERIMLRWIRLVPLLSTLEHTEHRGYINHGKTKVFRRLVEWTVRSFIASSLGLWSW